MPTFNNLNNAAYSTWSHIIKAFICESTISETYKQHLNMHTFRDCNKIPFNFKMVGSSQLVDDLCLA